MPLYLVEPNRTKLLSLRGLSIDVGDHDDFTHIRIGSRLFSDALAERDIPHVFEIYADGDHGNRIRERLKTRDVVSSPTRSSRHREPGPGISGEDGKPRVPPFRTVRDASRVQSARIAACAFFGRRSKVTRPNGP